MALDKESIAKAAFPVRPIAATLRDQTENICATVLAPLHKMKRADLCEHTKSALYHQPSVERMTIMTTHSSASMREEILHVTETTNTIISNALKRRAQSVINDTSIDPQWRAIVRYGLETNDPWLGDLVRRADAGEPIINTVDFSLEPDAEANDSK